MSDPNTPEEMNQPTSPQQAPGLGTLVADPATETRPTDTGLPPGAHPLDPSVPLGTDRSTIDRGGIATDTPGDRFSRGSKPWGTPNEIAFPVFQRASSDWDGGVVVANAGTNGGVATVVGRQKGRHKIRLWVPAKLADGTVPLPVIFGPNESELQTPNNSAAFLGVGDPPVEIETEGSVYIGVVGANATGTVQYVVSYNPLGGPAGGD